MNRTQHEPASKVWRYFDQKKAIHLIETSHLYLRRLDLLTDYFEGDPYEGNPTFSLVEGDIYAQRQVFGHADEASIRKRFEQERKATFVSCWQMSECESWLMWKQYCQRGGGVALQTTIGRLSALANNDSRPLLFQDVRYLDHYSDNSLEHQVPIQVFIKPRWFSDEKEIRLVLYRSDCVYWRAEAEIDQALTSLKDHELVLIDLTVLVEQIVLNPFSCERQKSEIRRRIESKCPKLISRLSESAIAGKPPLFPI